MPRAAILDPSRPDGHTKIRDNSGTNCMPTLALCSVTACNCSTHWIEALCSLWLGAFVQPIATLMRPLYIGKKGEF